MGTNEARQWEERVEEPLPRFLPPPSSPETAYLEMRLRPAKQSAEEEAEMGTRFVVRFSSKSDAFYENPVRGGTYRIKAGLPYVEEFESLAGCSALGQALQRRLGSDKVEFQAFEVRGKDWFPRFASSWAPPQWASNGGDMAGAPEGSRDRVGVVGEEAEPEVFGGSNKYGVFEEADDNYTLNASFIRLPYSPRNLHTPPDPQNDRGLRVSAC